ncbi:MAG: HlyD family efflux transporter periplasmic adaptor subunit [Bryobacteraceae bacterium]
MEVSKTRRLTYLLGAVIVAILLTGGWFAFQRVGLPAGAAGIGGATIENRAPGPLTQRSKTALIASTGWVEPEHGLISIAISPIAGRPPVIARLLVAEGSRVKRGQVLAELNSLPDLQASIRQAEARVDVSEQRVAQAKAGARPGDVSVMNAESARLEAERKAAQTDLARKEQLLKLDYVPLVQVEAARLRVEQSTHLIEETRQKLRSLTELRSSDFEVAEAELRAAKADLEHMRVNLASATVRAPADGRVLRVIAQVGEAVGPAGLLELAPAGRMAVIAEVYETDAPRLRVGQKARITGEVLAGPVTGTVTWISPQIEQQQSPSLDPAAYSEGRVFKVRVIVDQGELLENRIHAKVNVLITP